MRALSLFRSAQLFLARLFIHTLALYLGFEWGCNYCQSWLERASNNVLECIEFEEKGRGKQEANVLKGKWDKAKSGGWAAYCCCWLTGWLALISALPKANALEKRRLRDDSFPYPSLHQPTWSLCIKIVGESTKWHYTLTPPSSSLIRLSRFLFNARRSFQSQNSTCCLDGVQQPLFRTCLVNHDSGVLLLSITAVLVWTTGFSFSERSYKNDLCSLGYLSSRNVTVSVIRSLFLSLLRSTLPRSGTLCTNMVRVVAARHDSTSSQHTVHAPGKPFSQSRSHLSLISLHHSLARTGEHDIPQWGIYTKRIRAFWMHSIHASNMLW